MISTEAHKSWRLLIADDDPTHREWLRHHLDVLCQDATISQVTFAELLHRQDPVTRAECDLLVVTACFGASPEDPRATGLALLRKWPDSPSRPLIIALAKEGNELTAVRALQLGAGDYLPKRLLTPELLSAAIQGALQRLQQQMPAPMQMQLQLHVSAEATPTPTPTPTLGGPLPAEVLADPAVEPLEPQCGGLPVPAEVIGGLILMKRLSQAEHSSVYLAASERWGEVVLKISKSLWDEAGREHMARQYAAISAIRSPSVVTIHDFGVHGGFEHLVMEHLSRGSLKERMSHGLSVEETLHYAHTIACALQVIHAAGVLHRDLKPANVMLREDDGIALIDFELTHAVEDSGSPIGMLRGSPYYMSPEHALGEALDERSDFYSLGIMLYEMLTGRRPYTGSSALEVLQAHVSAPPPELPAELSRYDELLARLLAKERHERFESSAHIIAALEELKSATLDMAL